MIRLTNARNAEFNTHQDMMGHIYAKEQLAKAVEMLKKYTKSPKQKKLAKVAFRDSDNWHYWANEISDKYIAMVRYCLRRIDKKEYCQLLTWVEQKHGMLKSPFFRYMEYLAYRYQKAAAQEHYYHGMRYLGITQEQANQRLEKYYQEYLVKEFSK